MFRRTLLTGAAFFAATGITPAFAAEKPRSIIIYFSRTGHVAGLAKTLAGLTGARMLAVEPVTPYPEAYSETTEIVQDQMRKGIVPPIRPVTVNWDEIDTVYIGSPTWWGHLCRPIERFLTDYKFRGKKVYLFTSHGGSGRASTLDDVKRLCPDNNIAESIAFYGSGTGSEGQLKNWISN
jgi:flavodoxin